MAGAQLDLFGEAKAPEFNPDDYKPSPEFIGQIRRELEATLASVRGAERFPWRDLTQTMLGEMRFHSIVRWLPKEEAAALCAAFEVEMARLYEAEDARRAET